METTLILLKPDTVERGFIGQVITRLEQKGLKISGLKMMQLSDEIVTEHYDFLADKPFFPNIKEYMMRTPVVALAVSGQNAIATANMPKACVQPWRREMRSAAFQMSSEQNLWKQIGGPFRYFPRLHSPVFFG